MRASILQRREIKYRLTQIENFLGLFFSPIHLSCHFPRALNWLKMGQFCVGVKHSLNWLKMKITSSHAKQSNRVGFGSKSVRFGSGRVHVTLSNFGSGLCRVIVPG